MVETPTSNPAKVADGVARSAERLGEQAHVGIDRVMGTAHEAVDRAASKASSVADRIATSGEKLMTSGDEWIATGREYVREHPVAALGIALSVGYIISRLTAR